MNDLRVLRQGLPSPRVDIIFIHGLGGDNKTWTHPKYDHFWPQDALAKDIPDARIMTYSYDTKPISLRRPLSRNTFLHHAENLVAKLAAKRATGFENTRKVIFIAHSLGGLLAAQALQYISDDERPNVKQIISCTIGIIFFGVPFNGSKLAGPAKNSTSFLRLLLASTVNKSVLEVLESGSQMRANLQDFLTNLIEKRQEDLSVLTIVEELKTRRQEVVSKKSGRLFGAECISFHKNHAGLARFEYVFDKDYKSIVDDYLIPWITKHQPRAIIFDDLQSVDNNSTVINGQTRTRDQERDGFESSNDESLEHDPNQTSTPGSCDIQGQNHIYHGKKILRPRGAKYNNYCPTLNEQYQGIVRINTFNMNPDADFDDPPPLRVNTIPAMRDNHLVGREELLTELERTCKVIKSRTALQGLGGMGKSKLAIMYGARFAENYPDSHWVLWVEAGSRTRLKQSFQNIARRLKIPGWDKPNIDHVQIVHDKLCDVRNIKWLLIFDNVDELDVFNQLEQMEDGPQENNSACKESCPWLRCFPQNSNGSILITSRYKEITSAMIKPPDKTIQVDIMAEEDALALFGSNMSEQVRESDYRAVRELLKELNFIPLAIVQAASHIREEIDIDKVYSVNDYLLNFCSGSMKLLQNGEIESLWARDARREVIITWALSFGRIKKRRPSAAKLLYLMSYFDRQGIPKGALVGSAGAKGALFRPRQFSYSAELESEHIYQDVGFTEDIRLLLGYSFVSLNDDNSYKMHPLMHLAARGWRDAHPRSECFKRQFLNNIILMFPDKQFTYKDFYATLLPHLNVALKQTPSAGLTSHIWCSLMYLAADFAHFMGNFTDMERFAEAVVASAGPNGGPQYAVAQCCGYIGVVCEKRNNFEQSEDRFKEAISIYNRIGDEAIVRSLYMLLLLARLYNKYNFPGRVKLVYEEISLVHEQSNGKFNKNIDYLLCVGKMYQLSNKYDLARYALGKAVDVAEKYQRWDKMVVAKNMIASMYHLESQYIVSRYHFEDSLRTGREVLEADHPLTLRSLYNLAVISKELKEDEKALLSMKECYERGKIVLGPEHIFTQDSAKLIESWENEGIQPSGQNSACPDKPDFYREECEKEDDDDDLMDDFNYFGADNTDVSSMQ